MPLSPSQSLRAFATSLTMILTSPATDTDTDTGIASDSKPIYMPISITLHSERPTSTSEKAYPSIQLHAHQPKTRRKGKNEAAFSSIRNISIPISPTLPTANVISRSEKPRRLGACRRLNRIPRRSKWRSGRSKRTLHPKYHLSRIRPPQSRQTPPEAQRAGRATRIPMQVERTNRGRG